MSWFGSSVTIDEHVERATDESIPFGETDLATSLEVTDLIRSKQVPAKDAMRSLKKRLTGTKNPNTQMATLHLIDTCVKNGGAHFIVEIASREFIDTLVSLIHDDKTNESVRDLALDLIQSWAIGFKDNFQLKYISTTYTHLKDDGYSFPDVGTAISSTLFDSSAPPEWEDSDACMICSNAFSMLNRKHHCRNCGGVYCQTHSSKSIALPHLGITEPVRVCDTCYDEIHHKNKSNKKNRRSRHQKDVSRARAEYDSDDDEDLKKALALSLQESQAGQRPPPVPKQAPVAPVVDDDDDEDMKAAIAASLKQFEEEQQRHGLPLQPESAQPQPETGGPYSNLLPQSTYVPTYSNYEAPTEPAQQTQQFSSQVQYQRPPAPPQELRHYISSQEEHDIMQFSSKVEDLKRTPGQAIDNPELTDFYRKAIPLTPKLSSDMNDSFGRYDKLIDMNTKIDSIMRIYNNLLDRRIERESQQRQQYIAQPSYQTYGYPQAQHIPPQQFHAQHAPPQQQPQIPSQPVYQATSPQILSQQPQAPVQHTSPYPSHPYPVPVQTTGDASTPLVSEPPIVQQNTQESYEPPKDPFRTPLEEDEEEEFTAPPSEPVASKAVLQEPTPDHVPVPITLSSSPVQQQQQPSSPQALYQTPSQPQYYNGYEHPLQATPYPSQQKITDITFPTVPVSKPPIVEDVVAQAVVAPKEEALIEL